MNELGVSPMAINVAIKWLTNFYTYFHSAQTFKATPAQATKLLKLLRPKPVFQPKKTYSGPSLFISPRKPAHFQGFKTHHFSALRLQNYHLLSSLQPLFCVRSLRPFVTSLSLFIGLQNSPSSFSIIFPSSLRLLSVNFVSLLLYFCKSLTLFFFLYFYFYHVCCASCIELDAPLLFLLIFVIVVLFYFC